MKQFGKILKFELKSYLTNKVFVGITLFLVLAIAAVMFFPRVTEALKTESPAVEESEVKNRPVMLLKAEDPMAEDAFQTAFPE